MMPSGLKIEDLLPHRDRMLLVDQMIEVDDRRAVTAATVTDRWPFFDGRAVLALVLIELVAQTAGISNSWGGKRQHGMAYATRGWLVGIKHSRFYLESIPLGTRIITRTQNRFEYENYREIAGTAEIESRVAAKVELQLIRSDSSSETGDSR